jgi:hypothetical protein
VRDVNWLEVVAGFVLGLVPLVSRQLYIFIKYKRLPGRRKYLGTWYSYHRSTSGSGEVKIDQLKITYSILLGRLNVHAIGAAGSDAVTSRLAYSGHISAREGMVRYVTLKDSASHERLTWYLFDQFFDPFERTVGVYLALDLRGMPSAGAMMISRSELSSDEFEGCLDRHVVRVSAMLDTQQ